MEGPSLLIAAEQLQPFCGMKIIAVSGNSKAGKERMDNKIVRDIFSWGKHLVFQFDDFALRIHFLLWGSFEATVQGKSVNGDYKKAKGASPRLAFTFKNGHLEMYSCSVKFIELANAKSIYDFSTDVMSPQWNEKAALKKAGALPDSEISDVLLDQNIFTGVGNIIKNEVLYITRTHPQQKVGKLTKSQLKDITKEAHDFSHQFYAWRKEFVLKENLLVYRKSICPNCEGKVKRARTGLTERWSFYCPSCQKLTE
ncbi:MAG: endonuclease [Candidatus Doudnabacteria bacterium]